MRAPSLLMAPPISKARNEDVNVLFWTDRRQISKANAEMKKRSPEAPSGARHVSAYSSWLAALRARKMAPLMSEKLIIM